MKVTILQIIVIFVAYLCVYVSPQQIDAAENSEENNWRTTSGTHVLTTDQSTGAISWNFTWSDREKTHHENRKFSTIDSFENFFSKESFSKQVNTKIVGMWNLPSDPPTNKKQNEALLKFIRDAGYEESGYDLVKRKWPNGGYCIYWWHKDNKISLTYVGISQNRMVETYAHGFTIEEFKREFSSNKHNRLSEITVSYYPNSSHATEANEIHDFLKQHGYKVVQIELEDTN